MVKQQVKVVIRTRPTPDFAAKNISLDTGNETVTISIPKDETRGVVNNQTENWKFKFDKLMHNASQENVFDYCVQESVASVVDGYNGTVLCYGQTGAGKTFTMTGSTANYKYRGLIPRAINKIFQEVGGRFDTQITVKISFIEIYNELLFDMLSGVPPHEQTGTSISVQDDAKGDVHLKGLTMIKCKNEEEALNCLFEGEQMRTVGGNAININSSRSHAIFSIHLESRSTIETSEKVIHSQLNLVDLAGNERTKKSGAEGLALKEANYINQSLSYLEQVVVGTCDKKRDHVPYRSCKLTNILKNSIGGNCKTILIANIFPETKYIEETLSTLRFATRMKNVANECSVNEALDQPLLIKKMEREIRDLKQELSMHDVLASKGAHKNKTEPYTAQEAYKIQLQSQAYLNGETEDIDSLTSMRQVNEYLHQMRNLFRKMKQESDNLLASNKDIKFQGVSSANNELQRGETLRKDGVGEILDVGEFGLGLAPLESKPVSKIEISKEREEAIARMENFQEFPESQDELIHQEEEQSMIARMSKSRKQNADRRPAIDKQAAFVEFKTLETESGPAHEKNIRENRADLKNTRLHIKGKTELCNKIKAEIDDVKSILDQMTEKKKQENFNAQMSPGFGQNVDGYLEEDNEKADEIIDEAELNRLKQLKDLKRQYRDNFKELKDLKSQASFQQQSIDNSKSQLVRDFEQWYEESFQGAEQPSIRGSTAALNNSTQSMSRYSPTRLVRDPAMDDDQEVEAKEREGVDVDNDALKYIQARRNVHTLAAARKQL